ncbi:hypothetical protein HKX48_001557 [Thoreauomyces humboldtii]|nr:hypothetical protein HKX48_001557 [Thoreauomyces humboldtii]
MDRVSSATTHRPLPPVQTPTQQQQQTGQSQQQQQQQDAHASCVTSPITPVGIRLGHHMDNVHHDGVSPATLLTGGVAVPMPSSKRQSGIGSSSATSATPLVASLSTSSSVIVPSLVLNDADSMNVNRSFTTSSSGSQSHQPQGGRLSIETTLRRQSLAASERQQQVQQNSTPSAIAARPLSASHTVPTPPTLVAAPTSPTAPAPSAGIRRSKSLSFFVDLLSPISRDRSPSPTKRARTDDPNTPSYPNPRTAPSPPPSFAAFSRNRASGAEIYRRMTQRLARAQALRESVLHDRRSRLRRRFEQIRYRILLQRQRDRLNSLKIQARSEYAISAANLKRQLILKKNIDRCGAAVEHAQTVAMAHKLRKFMELRRSFSENFVELLAESQSLGLSTGGGGGGGPDVMQATGLGVHRTLSMVDMDMDEHDDDAFVMEDAVHDVSPGLLGGPASSPSFSHTSPSSDRHPHVDLAALRVSVLGASLKSGASSSYEDPMVSEGARAKAAEPGSARSGSTFASLSSADDSVSGHAQSGSSSAYDGGASAGTGGGPTGNGGGDGHHDGMDASSPSDQHPNESLDPSSDRESETLAATVRRLRVLPVSILEDMEESDYLQLLSLLPPITRFTLRELELTEILSNAQLRHDLYFDPELQFKPNLDGEKGDQKREAGDIYWTEVEAEVRDGGHLYRLPLLLYEIRCIIIELLPYSQDRREEVDRNLDIQLVAQQIEHGVLNAVGLVTYLAELLKANCAPARDDLVDAMVEECKGGNFVKTLRQCFEVLELMKLDFANHQLHRIRPYVVEHAADFEWRWFKDQYEMAAIKLDDTKSWISAALARHNAGLTAAPAPGATIAPSAPLNPQHLHARATLHLISQSHLLSLPTPPIPLPETLRMDVSRLVQYYNDWQDVTIMAALLVLFKQACAPKPATAAQLDSMKRVLWVLLNDHETSMTHVTLQMCKTAGDVRGRVFSDREREMLTGLVESTLQPESRLYEVIRSRVGNVVERLVLAAPETATANNATAGAAGSDGKPQQQQQQQQPTTVTKQDLAKVGLAELEDEVTELGDRVRRLVAHNWGVYAGVYAGVLEGLSGTGPRGGDASAAVETAMRA